VRRVVWFVLGVEVGAVIGVLTAGLLVAASSDDEVVELFSHRSPYPPPHPA
jgi:hypothetical protein